MSTNEATVALTLQQRFQSIPQHLKITILYHDKQIVAINKPNNLRSVPGNAQQQGGQKRQRHEQRLTAHEAWIAALDSLEIETSDGVDSVQLLTRNLTLSKSNFSSIPRKWKAFNRYVQRNQNRLLLVGEDCQKKFETGKRCHLKQLDVLELEFLAKQAHALIESRQRQLMNVPESTSLEDSAFGQLLLLGYGTSSDTGATRLHVVHRLDCETSGVMVFARDEDSASDLCKAWRERDRVQKTYLARVTQWPPLGHQGEINLALSQSDAHLKWKVDTKGKPCQTIWRVERRELDSILLSLTPITGRTHQLRIHCAEIGSGIQGDSLYGTNGPKHVVDPRNPEATKLLLHAHKLMLPHPKTGEQHEFTSSPSWDSES